MQGGYDDTVIDQEIARVGGCLIIDAKGVYDAIHRSESAALSMQDKRSAVEGLALREGVGRTKTLLRWCHSEANVEGRTDKIGQQSSRVVAQVSSIQGLENCVGSRLHKFQETQTAEERKAIKNFVMNV